jgi:hypothetical protein
MEVRFQFALQFVAEKFSILSPNFCLWQRSKMIFLSCPLIFILGNKKRRKKGASKMKKIFSVKIKMAAEVADESQPLDVSFMSGQLSQFFKLLKNDPIILNQYYQAMFYHQYLEDSDDGDVLRKELGYVGSYELFETVAASGGDDLKMLIKNLYSPKISDNDKLEIELHDTFSKVLSTQLGPLQIESVQFSLK